MRYEEFYRFLGLGARARALALGAGACMDAVKKKKAKLVVIDGSASDNTKKEFSDACRYRQIEYIILEDKDIISRYVSKKDYKVIGVLSEDFAASAMEKYSRHSGGENIE